MPTKIAADQLAQSYYSSFGLVSIIRPFNTYGPRQSNELLYWQIRVISNKKGYNGSLYPTRDFHCEDVKFEQY